MQYACAMMPLLAQQCAVYDAYIVVLHNGAEALNPHSRQEERGG
jgi:hypothetical protein